MSEFGTELLTSQLLVHKKLRPRATIRKPLERISCKCLKEEKENFPSKEFAEEIALRKNGQFSQNTTLELAVVVVTF